MIKLILFDLDDTLYPEEQFVEGGLQAVAREISVWLQVPFIELYNQLQALRKCKPQNLFDRMLEMHGIFSPDNVHRLVNVYRTHEPKLTFYADAKLTLDALQEKKIRLGLVTDGYLSVQRRKIMVLGLEAILGPIICTDQWGRDFWKPHPRAFEFAMQVTQTLPNECIYVGDNPQKDFIAPRMLGMRSVRVIRKTGIYRNEAVPPGGEPDAEVSNLAELFTLPWLKYA